MSLITVCNRVFSLENNESKALLTLIQARIAFKAFERVHKLLEKKEMTRRLNKARKFRVFVQRSQWPKDNSEALRGICMEK